MITKEYFKFGKLEDYDLFKLNNYIKYFDKNTSPSQVYNPGGSSLNLKTRSSQTFFLDKKIKFLKDYFSFFVLQQIPSLKLYNFDLSYQYVIYNEGDFFKTHKDRLPSKDSFVRAFTISINLTSPDEYLGGELLIYHPNGKKFALDKVPGSYTLFPSLFRHEVTPIISGTRRAMVIWVEMEESVLVE